MKPKCRNRKYLLPDPIIEKKGEKGPFGAFQDLAAHKDRWLPFKFE